MRGLALAAIATGGLAVACGGSDATGPLGTATTSSTSTASTTSIPDTGQVTPILSEGPVTIQFLDSAPVPGSTLSGCGTHVEGCRGRLAMSFRLLSRQNGTASRMDVFLHATNQAACLMTRTGPIEVRAGIPLDLDLVLNQTDLTDFCRAPLTMATMDAVLTGPIEVASRQAWSLFYRFEP